MEQQERALAAYLDSVRDDPGVLAVIVVGSVAQGREREDSDIDVYLVVREDRFAAETAAGRFAWIERYGLDYPGSYIDIKLASPSYLAAAAESADDPTRASFLGARIAWRAEGPAASAGALPDLEETIERITVLPDDVWDGRVRSYLSQARLYGGYFLRQALERGDEFLRRHAALHLALAAARAALAAAHVMLPGPKYISQLVTTVPTPDGFVGVWERVVTDPDADAANALLGILFDWLGGDLDQDETLSIFIRDNELAWLRGTVPAEYW
ncbi:nucleotidyltransferase domain-containing protein [Microbacterium sp. HD4P20]|uniref:nucleotidyltransferase domain-containing protein n=1 Tax=Microbacterium sp. HD4P20 TaxID=2864874 RepID=UPI001C6423B0|nr:nucleotidyltransferase domain-containing protein [Microbacterium sp. HD4P20]MCP2635875.1 nucleotidyltransferase domain-containing protein [Microbacterium sp. HD4P20]